MLLTRRSVYKVLAAAGILGATLAAAPVHVSATTGPTQFLPAPKYKVDNKTALLYTGRYSLKSVAAAARMRGGDMGIEINVSDGALYGIAQFYGYDKTGSQSTWVGTLYNFQQLKNKQMNMEILSSTGQTSFGKMTLTRSAKGDLSGQIHLSSGTFVITWHKLSSR